MQANDDNGFDGIWYHGRSEHGLASLDLEPLRVLRVTADDPRRQQILDRFK